MEVYTFNMWFLFTFVTMVEIVWHFDLIFTLKRPFENGNKRAMLYIVFAVIISLAQAISILAADMNLNALGPKIIFFSTKALYCAVFPFSMGSAIGAYRKKGLSKQFRNLLFKRHISFCMLSICCQFTSTTEYLQGIGVWDPPNYIKAFLVYYFVFAGFFFATLKLLEPIVYSTLKHDILTCF